MPEDDLPVSYVDDCEIEAHREIQEHPRLYGVDVRDDHGREEGATTPARDSAYLSSVAILVRASRMPAIRAPGERRLILLPPLPAAQQFYFGLSSRPNSCRTPAARLSRPGVDPV